tara:strand:- start:2172 stop:2930 length:759 start_codon:yes stop_codon:yes gene_type:complete
MFFKNTVSKEFKSLYIKLFLVLFFIGVASIGFLGLNGTSRMSDAVSLVFFSTAVTYLKWGVIALFICKATSLSFKEKYGQTMINLIAIFWQLFKSIIAWVFLVSIFAVVVGGVFVGDMKAEEVAALAQDNKVDVSVLAFLFGLALFMYFALVYAKQNFDMFVFNKIMKLNKEKPKVKGFMVPLKAFKLRNTKRNFAFVFLIVVISLLKGFLSTLGLSEMSLILDPAIGVVFCALMSGKVADYAELEISGENP